MNNRIQELEKQSYTESMHEMGGTYMVFDKEKFAELIIRECIYYAFCHGDDIEYVKKHFGVEK